MIINEDFFDNTDIDIATRDINISEVDTDRYQFRLLCYGLQRKITYNVRIFEKCLDLLPIEHGEIVVSEDETLGFSFNHSFKSPEDIIKFIKILWVASWKETEVSKTSCLKLFQTQDERNFIVICLTPICSFLIDPVNHTDVNDNMKESVLKFTNHLTDKRFSKDEVYSAMGFPQNNHYCITNMFIVFRDGLGEGTYPPMYFEAGKWMWTSVDNINYVVEKFKYKLSVIESHQSINTYLKEFPIEHSLKDALAKTKFGKKIIKEHQYIYVDFYNARYMTNKNTRRYMYIFPIGQKIIGSESYTYFVKVDFGIAPETISLLSIEPVRNFIGLIK